MCEHLLSDAMEEVMEKAATQFPVFTSAHGRCRLAGFDSLADNKKPVIRIRWLPSRAGMGRELQEACFYTYLLVLLDIYSNCGNVRLLSPTGRYAYQCSC